MVKEQHKWIIEELKVLRDKGLIARPRARSNKGYANFPIKWSVEGNFKDYGQKENGVLFKALASYGLGDDRGGIVFIDMETRQKSHDTQLNKTLKDDDYISYRKRLTDKYATELIDFCNNVLSKENIDATPKKQLMEYYNTFREIYTKFEFYNGIWFIISDDLAKIIIDRMRTLGCTDFEEIQTLMTPTFQSFINRETIDLLSAAKDIQTDPLALDLIKKEDYENFMKTSHGIVINSLVEKYYWIPFGHVGPDLYDAKHYFSEVRKQVLENTNLLAELQRAKTFYSGILQSQKVILKKYSVDAYTIRLIKDLHILAQFQDERKEIIARTHVNWITNLMGKIGSYFNLSGRKAAELFPTVVEKCLLHDIIDLEEFEKDEGNHRSFRLIEPDGYTNYYDEEAEPFLSIIESEPINEELRGESACSGMVTGRAKVLKNSDEIYKVEKGDILVTTMTTPDFVPAMRKAAAIVTDEGGITCHAAIVSRELGIPCVINTKNATRLLKDGDIIEVDATTGKVTKKNVSVVALNDLKDATTNTIGGKAFSLVKMLNSFPVPNGYCVTSELFKKYIDTTTITSKLATLDLDNISQTTAICKSIQESVKNIKLDEADVKLILKFFDDLNCKYVAVRSSGTAEDMSDAAFAGQHDTYLYVGKDKLVDRIIDCFASVYSTRAVYYRDMKKIGHDVAMAVVVQAMVDSEKSGVMYTKNPSTGNDEVIIEVSHGLGELVVSGKVNPDRINYTKSGWDYKIGGKDKMMTFEGIVDNPLCNNKALNDKELSELLSYAKRLEKHFGYPQDIEFAFDKDKLFILQSRNLTTIKKS